MPAPQSIEPAITVRPEHENVAELLARSRSKRFGSPQIDKLGALERNARTQNILISVTSKDEKQCHEARQKLIEQGQRTGLSKEKSTLEADAEIISGRSLSAAIKTGKTDDIGKILKSYESGASAKDILDQMQKWGYSSFVKSELARLASYKSTELKQQMALFEISESRTDAAQYAREFALSLRELTRYAPESYKDEFERYAGMFNEISSMGKEVKADSGIGNELKKTTLEITKNLDGLLSRVVAESNLAIESTVRDGSKTREDSKTARRMKVTDVSHSEFVKIKPKLRDTARFDGRAELKENKLKLGRKEESETLLGQSGGFKGRKGPEETVAGQRGGMNGRKEFREELDGQIGGIKGRKEESETVAGQRGGFKGKEEEPEIVKGQIGGFKGTKEDEEVITGQKGGLKGRRESEEEIKGQRGGFKGKEEPREDVVGQRGGFKGKREPKEDVKGKDDKQIAKLLREQAKRIKELAER